MLLRALAEPVRRNDLDSSERRAGEKKVLRVGVAENAKADAQVAGAFAATVDALRTLGHEMVKTTAPFDIPGFGDLHAIEVDRQNISDCAFRDIDILVLPTLTGTVPGSIRRAEIHERSLLHSPSSRTTSGRRPSACSLVRSCVRLPRCDP